MQVLQDLQEMLDDHPVVANGQVAAVDVGAFPQDHLGAHVLDGRLRVPGVRQASWATRSASHWSGSPPSTVTGITPKSRGRNWARSPMYPPRLQYTLSLALESGS